MLQVHFYMKKNCPLCDEAKTQLWILQQEYAFEVEERNIHTHDEWLMAYQLRIPVVEINGIFLDCESFSYASMESLLQENS